ncbi:MAG: hypothetical protein AAFN10_20390 [Bacteroidota bacterium]
MKTTYLAFVLFTILGLGSMQAQELRLGFQQESASFPFTRFAELHPGVELSYGFAPKPKDETNRSTQWWISGGYFYHREVEAAYYLKASYAWQMPLGDIAQLELAPSLGYLHSFYPGNVYELQDGEYQAITQYGRPHVMAEVGFTALFLPNSKVRPFVQYRFGIESPFANGIPAFPHSFYQIGLSYNL